MQKEIICISSDSEEDKIKNKVICLNTDSEDENKNPAIEIKSPFSDEGSFHGSDDIFDEDKFPFLGDKNFLNDSMEETPKKVKAKKTTNRKIKAKEVKRPKVEAKKVKGKNPGKKNAEETLSDIDWEPSVANVDANPLESQNNNGQENENVKKRRIMRPKLELDDFFVNNFAMDYIESEEEVMPDTKTADTAKDDSILDSSPYQSSLDSIDRELGISPLITKKKKKRKITGLSDSSKSSLSSQLNDLENGNQLLPRKTSSSISTSITKNKSEQEDNSKAISPPANDNVSNSNKESSGIELNDEFNDQTKRQNRPKPDPIIDGLDPELQAIYEEMFNEDGGNAAKDKNNVNGGKCHIRCNFPIVPDQPILASKNKWHRPIEFILTLNDDFQIMLHSLADKKKVNYQKICIEYQQVKVFPYTTPEGLGIKEGDTIQFDVYLSEIYEKVLENRKKEKEEKMIELEKQEIESIWKPEPVDEVVRYSIFVKPPKGEVIKFKMNLESTIQTLLDNVKQKLNSGEAKMKLEFDGILLDPTLKLKETELENEDMVNLWIE
ncbi:hypothetical protein K502DRAFT_328359 [Neoconidiobolus thromboides FSU 785]|nr:hypothetical protein K502DRAFT_328359 [Neoconidiobolus thromboides FSU 785]